MLGARDRPGRWLHAFFVVSLLWPFVLPFPYVRALNNPNELVRVYTVIALVEQGSYRIDEQVDLFGWCEDLARVKDPGGGSHYAMVKAPGLLYAGVPAYAVFSKIVAPLVLGERYPARLQGQDEEALEWKRLDWLRRSTWAMRLSALQLPCFLFLLWFERWLRRFSGDAVLRYIVVLAAGVGTNFLAYAHMFASHSMFAIAGFVAFALLERALAEAPDPTAHASRHRGRCVACARAALWGFLTSLCVALEYQALFFAAVIAALAAGLLAARRRFRELGAFLGGGLVNVLHVMWFQRRAYGDAFSPGHKLIENARFAAEHRTGLFGISWPRWGATKALLFDPNFGFLGLSPFMWLGLAAIPVALLGGRRLRVLMLAWLACMIAVVGVNAGFVEWRAGWTVGARYLVVCAPFFAFAALLTLERLAGGADAEPAASPGPRRLLARAVGAGLALAGVVSVGTVSVLVDTLPDTMGRPFAQFFVPMMRLGLVPHDLGEAIGLPAGPFFALAVLAMLLAPVVLLASGVTTASRRSPRGGAVVATVVFALAFGAGVARAFTAPKDGTALFLLHPSVTGFAERWEPSARREPPRARKEAPLADHTDERGQNCRVAMRAPSAIAASFAQVTSGSTAACPTHVP